MSKSLNHIKKEIMNMSCEEILELQDFMNIETIGEQSTIRGGSSRNPDRVKSCVIQPPIELSPQMVKITEKNLSQCFKTETEPAWKTQQRTILANIRRNY